MKEERCKHDMLPSGCADCRGIGQVADPYEGLLIERFYSSAQFDQACAVFPEKLRQGHLIVKGERFARAVQDGPGPPYKKFGYVCEECTNKIAPGVGGA